MAKGIFNENVYLKHQMSILFSILVIFSFGATLGLCLGFLYTLGDESQNTAEDRILSRTFHNAKVDGQDIAAAIEERLTTTAESTCMATALFSSLLIDKNKADNDELRFSIHTTYREYNFVENCTVPLCPSDYGPLSQRSRVPNLNGTMEATSLYLYSSIDGQGIKSDTRWDTIMNDNFLSYVQDTISYQDESLIITYPLADDVMFLYLSVAISQQGGGYNVLHRVYPGTIRNGTSYDPTKRPWFTHAPIDSITVQGPYVETFTKKSVLNLSSRKVLSLYSSGILTNIHIVGATVLLLDTISEIVSNMDYPNNGFGVLLKYDTMEVIVWGNNTNTFDPLHNQFLTISHFDSTLVDKNLQKRHAFRHVDPNGTRWVISSTPFLAIQDYETSESQYGFILLVYSEWKEAFQSLPVLNESIDETETSITLLISIIAIVVTVVLLLGINIFVLWLTSPLQTILNISHDLMKISSEEERNKDYLPFVDQGIAISSTRTDEIGMLSSIFWQMIWKLHQDNLKKKQTPKYPSNPFYSPSIKSHSLYGSYTIQSTDVSSDLLLSISNILNHFPEITTSQQQQQQQQQQGAHKISSSNEASAPDIEEVGVEMSSTDVLSRIGYHLTLGEDGEPTSPPGKHSPSSSPSSEDHKAHPSHGIVSDIASYPGRILHQTRFTVDFYLSGIGLIIFLGLCSLVIITIVIIRSESYSWMNETGKSLTTQQISHLYTLTNAKSQYSLAYFNHIALDTQVISRQLSSLLDDYDNGNLLPFGNELQSYSNDPYNDYSYPASSSKDFSGYFSPNDVNCQSLSQCTATYLHNTTRVTSLIDLQMMTLFHSRSITSFVQFGMESDGFSRTYPYGWTTYSEQSQCYIAYLGSSLCQNKYYNSQCSTGNFLTPYPVYDPRCRLWYGLGSQPNSSPLLTYFQEPRVASNGKYVVTAVTPFHSQNNISKIKYGVLNLNTQADVLSQFLNSFKILDSGYIYLLDARNITTIILHPQASSTCTTLLCCEKRFSSSEYSLFLTILSSLSSSSSQDIVYSKGGENWLLVNSGFQSETIDYLVIATVPMNEILEPSHTVDQTIDSTVAVIIAVSVIVIVIFLIFIILCIYELIQTIQQPVSHLISLCQNIMTNNLTISSLTKEIQCRDMKILLDTFRNIVIVLRFGNEAYVAGNIHKALQVYLDALVLYETLSNEKGISSCHNNLGGIYLTMKVYQKSEFHYQTSIKLATEQVIKLTNLSEKDPTNEKFKLQLLLNEHILSDRQANYSLLLIEQKRYAEAYHLLESCLEQDLMRGYINGCVNKQGYLGYLYLHQNEMKSAEKQFLNSLLFLNNETNQMKLQSKKWTEEEIEISKQIALFNYGKYYEEKKDMRMAIHYYVMSVMLSPMMHTMTTIKALSRLYSLYLGSNSLINSSSSGYLIQLERICERYSLNITNKRSNNGSGSGSSSSVKKRVAIALDYSGSMSGTKIRSAVENILTLFNDQIYSIDELMMIHFNSNISIDLPFTIKEGNEDRIRSIIQGLTSPFNSTLLYDAISQCISSTRINQTSNDWIVILTDGEDTGSRISKESLQQSLSQGQYGVILIGVGSDVNHVELEKLISQNSKGFYVQASGDKEGITRAFGQVRNLMQENIVFEEI